MKTVSRKVRWRKRLDPVKRRAMDCFDNLWSRCNNQRSRVYHHYGGRGIEARITRQDFIAWYIQEAGGRTDLTIDRIDNDGHYELGNIQLITNSDNLRKAHRESNAMKSADSKKGLLMAQSRRISVLIHGVEYPSMEEASFALGRASGYISQRMKANHSLMPDGSRIEAC